MKITADTNLLVRAIMGDDKRQSRLAQTALANAEVVALAMPALCELVWVLSQGYKIPSADIAEAIRRLMNGANVAVNRPAAEAGLALLDAGALSRPQSTRLALWLIFDSVVICLGTFALLLADLEQRRARAGRRAAGGRGRGRVARARRPGRDGQVRRRHEGRPGQRRPRHDHHRALASSTPAGPSRSMA